VGADRRLANLMRAPDGRSETASPVVRVVMEPTAAYDLRQGWGMDVEARWRAVRVLIVAVVATVGGACAGSAASTTGGPPPGAVAEATSGAFRLRLELPRSDWLASDTITGQATLSNVGVSAVQFGTSGEPIILSFGEVGGGRRVTAFDPVDCGYRTLEVARPIVVPLTNKMGAYRPDAPPSDFPKWFITNSRLQLPVGTWRVTAVAYVGADQVCVGGYDLEVSVELHVAS
jgi:hypothetical protein